MASLREQGKFPKGKFTLPLKKKRKENKFWGIGFSKTSLKTAMNHLIESYYLNVGNVTMN